MRAIVKLAQGNRIVSEQRPPKFFGQALCPKEKVRNY